MTDLMPWLALSALGAFHGINPAMGWLFIVALAQHRNDRRMLVIALVPIAAGHALSIALVVGLVAVAGTTIPEDPVRYATGAVLLAWAGWHSWRGHRQRVRVGLRTGMLGLVTWSFLMATAHGAGLMLVPALMPLTHHAGHAGHAAPMGIGESLVITVAAVGVHTLAMLVTTGAIASGVYTWLDLGFLRRGWINLDRLWTIALLVTGIILLLP